LGAADQAMANMAKLAIFFLDRLMDNALLKPFLHLLVTVNTSFPVRHAG